MRMHWLIGCLMARQHIGAGKLAQVAKDCQRDRMHNILRYIKANVTQFTVNTPIWYDYTRCGSSLMSCPEHMQDSSHLRKINIVKCHSTMLWIMATWYFSHVGKRTAFVFFLSIFYRLFVFLMSKGTSTKIGCWMSGSTKTSTRD